MLRKHTKSIVNQLLREPITRVKELAGEEHADEALELFTKIFALESELETLREQERVKQVEQQWENTKQSYVPDSAKHEAVVRS